MPSDQPVRVQMNADAIWRIAARGAELLAAGQFSQAIQSYARVVAADPDNRPAHLALASLLNKIGHEEEGQALLRDFFTRRPLGSPPKGSLPARPLMMKVRGFSGTKAVLGKRRNGMWKRKLRGGHFTTRYLLRKPAFAVQTFTVAGDNLEQELMPEHDLMLNTIAEPDIEGPSLDALSRYLERKPGTAVINRPDRILATTRDGNWQRLKDFEGIIFPVTKRLSFVNAGPDEIRHRLAATGIEAPLIFRRVGTQTGRTTVLLERHDDPAACPASGLTGEFYAIAYREILWRGAYFRKLRLFHIDGTYYPVVCHLDRIWNVHGGNRKELMRDNEDLMAEEKRFLADWRSYVGSANVDHLDRIAEHTGLDFFGIDFTLTEDGQIFIYELNAAMRHSFDHAENFPYKLPYDHAVSDAFEAMVDNRLAQATQ